MGCSSSKRQKVLNTVNSKRPSQQKLPPFILNTKEESTKNQLKEAIQKDDTVLLGELLFGGIIKPNEALNELNQTSLHIAALSNSPQCMEGLIVSMQAENDTEIDKIVQFQDVQGQSCLHYCVSNNSKESLYALLTLLPQTSLEKKNKDGKTCVELAKEKKNCVGIVNNYLPDEKKIPEDDAQSMLLESMQLKKKNMAFRVMTKATTWTQKVNIFEGLAENTETYSILDKCEKENSVFVDGDHTNYCGGVELKRAAQIFDCENNDVNLFPLTAGFPINLDSKTSTPLFYSFIAALSEQPSKLKEIFVNKFRNPFGVYGLYAYKNGCKKEILLDDSFPTGGDFKWTTPEQNDIWLLLLEKLYAKLTGSYKSIESDDIEHLISTFLGIPIEKFEVDGIEDDFLWALLTHAVQMKVLLMSFPRLNNSQLPPGQVFALVNAQQLQDGRKIIKLRNRFMKEKFKGEFADEIGAWSDQIKNQVNFNEEDQEETLYLTFDEFRANFGKLYLALSFPGWSYNSVEVVGKKKRAEYFLLDVQTSCEAYIRLHQKKDNGVYSLVNFVLCKIGDDRQLVPNGEGELECVNGKECVSIRDNPKINLSPGKYIIRAKVEWKYRDQEKYTVSCYSEYPVTLTHEPRDQHKIFMNEYFKAKFSGEHQQGDLAWTQGWIHNYMFICFENKRPDRHMNACIKGIVRENIKLGKPCRTNQNEFLVSMGPLERAGVYLKKLNPNLVADFQWEMEEKD